MTVERLWWVVLRLRLTRLVVLLQREEELISGGMSGGDALLSAYRRHIRDLNLLICRCLVHIRQLLTHFVPKHHELLSMQCRQCLQVTNCIHQVGHEFGLIWAALYNYMLQALLHFRVHALNQVIIADTMTIRCNQHDGTKERHFWISQLHCINAFSKFEC